MELAPFEFAGNNFRILKDANDDPWFVAKDVCDILGTDPKDIPAILESDEYTTVYTIEGRNKISGLRKDTRLISEPGFYNLVMVSRKPEAEAFRKWVCGEVLPSIRKSGGYMLARADETPEELLERAMGMAEDILQKRGGNVETSPAVEAMLADPDSAIQALKGLKKERTDKLTTIEPLK